MTSTRMIEMAKHHRDQDMLIAGTYGDKSGGEFRGCSVRCFAHDLGLKFDDHAGVAAAFEIPTWAVMLQDTMFEGLPAKKRKDWHVDFAIRCSGVSDWSDALHRVHIAILKISLQHAGKAKSVIQIVIDLHETQEQNKEKWVAVCRAAKSAAKSVAWSAAWGTAKSAAWSAAWGTAESAAESVIWSVAWSAAWNAAYGAPWSAAWNAAYGAAYEEMRNPILNAMTLVKQETEE